MKTPLIVTHGSSLLHGGLRRIFAKSQFGPLFIAPKLSEELESKMRSFESCIWLVGVTRYDSTISDVLRPVTNAVPGVKPVILAANHAPDDVVIALRAGFCGFLSQDICPEQLLKSLELIVCGQAVVPRDCHLRQTSPEPIPVNGETEEHGAFQTNGIDSYPNVAAHNAGQMSESDLTQSLTRRELLIMRMLTEGASNKVIALKLVITESTVKVHMKAILRKLRLQNRTQAAMWARNHINEDVWIRLSSPAHRAENVNLGGTGGPARTKGSNPTQNSGFAH
jgi:two-component system, NarL family, nitrate/nitrite response regulator NarL